MNYYLYGYDESSIQLIADQNRSSQVKLTKVNESDKQEFAVLQAGDFILLHDRKKHLCRLILKVEAAAPEQVSALIVQKNGLGIPLSEIVSFEITNVLTRIGIEYVNHIVKRLAEVNLGLLQAQPSGLPKLKERVRKTYSLNRIFYGAPGTGKTYSTAVSAVAICCPDKSLKYYEDLDRKTLMDQYNKLVDDERISFVTFHQSYGYEDFVQGIRPDVSSGDMKFKTEPGVLMKIASRAMNDSDNDYVLIIDEINRGNISKIFGELITLLEEDKRWGEVNGIQVKLPSGDPFAMPNNLYVIGTMNSADKSISLIDAALRRRFEFIEVLPDENMIHDETMKNLFLDLNKALDSKLHNPDLLIGHSYFMNHSSKDLPDILNNKVIPLLYEYMDDDEDDVRDVLTKADIDSRSLSFVKRENYFSRIRVE